METTHEDKIKYSHKILELHCMGGLKHFKKVLRSYLIFHVAFMSVLVTELIVSLVLYSSQIKATTFALSIALFVLSIFYLPQPASIHTLKKNPSSLSSSCSGLSLFVGARYQKISRCKTTTYLWLKLFICSLRFFKIKSSPFI